MMVYDITDEQSFKDLDFWMNQVCKLILIEESFTKSEVVMMLVGNKSDLENRSVPKQTGLKYAENKRIAFY